MSIALLIFMLPAMVWAAGPSKANFKIAVALGDSGASIFSLMGNNVKQFVKLAGGTVVFERTGFNADKQIAFVENQIAAGCNGIIIAPAADSVATIIKKLCEEAGVYWGIPFRSIGNTDIRKIVESSKYYVGNCYENEKTTAYEAMKKLSEKGMKKIAFISLTIGDTTAGQREAGVQAACADFGMEVVAEARGLNQASDVTSTTESFLSSHKDLDCVFILSTTAAGALEAAGKAIRDSGRKNVKLACIDFQDGMVKLFDEGILACVSGLPHWGFDPFMVTVKTVNAVMGYPISDSSFSTAMKMLILTDAKSAHRYEEIFAKSDKMFYSDKDMINLLLKKNNPALSPRTFQEIVDNFNPLQ
jgi:ribose transport system substrate-binding protein